MTHGPGALPAAGTIPTSPLPPSVRQRIFLYLGVLIIFLSLGSPFGGLIDIPISFFLKNKLHLEAHDVANFRLVAAIPLYLSCVFGFVRDTWNPFGMGDRGFMVLFGGISAAALRGLRVHPDHVCDAARGGHAVDRRRFLFVSSAQNGLTSTIGQQHAMSGQISAAWNVFCPMPTLLRFLIGGYLSDLLGRQTTPIRLPAFCFLSVPRSWPSSLHMPSGSRKAYSTTSRMSGMTARLL